MWRGKGAGSEAGHYLCMSQFYYYYFFYFFIFVLCYVAFSFFIAFLGLPVPSRIDPNRLPEIFYDSLQFSSTFIFFKKNPMGRAHGPGSWARAHGPGPWTWDWTPLSE